MRTKIGPTPIAVPVVSSWVEARDPPHLDHIGTGATGAQQPAQLSLILTLQPHSLTRRMRRAALAMWNVPSGCRSHVFFFRYCAATRSKDVVSGAVSDLA